MTYMTAKDVGKEMHARGTFLCAVMSCQYQPTFSVLDVVCR